MKDVKVVVVAFPRCGFDQKSIPLPLLDEPH